MVRFLIQRAVLLAAGSALVVSGEARGQQIPTVAPLSARIVAPTRGAVLAQLRQMPNGAALAAKIASTNSGGASSGSGVTLDFTHGVFAAGNGSMQVTSILNRAFVVEALDPSGALQTDVRLEVIPQNQDIVLGLKPSSPPPSGWVIVSVQVRSTDPAVTLTPVPVGINSSAYPPPMVCSRAVLLATSDTQGVSTCIVPVPMPSAMGAEVHVSTTSPNPLRIVSASVTPM